MPFRELTAEKELIMMIKCRVKKWSSIFVSLDGGGGLDLGKARTCGFRGSACGERLGIAAEIVTVAFSESSSAENWRN